uniref:peptidylprolyl isomerase n=1 Tax=Arcella intermedia TaxID=1963864 RepID=A0A6B2L8Q0_9EUKA
MGHGLDSTLSVGLGAASYASLVAYGAQQFQIEDKTFTPTEQELEGAMDETELQRCIKMEEEMSHNDRMIEERAHERNILESFLFQTKSHLTDPKFGDCFDATSKEQIEGIITTGTFWLEDNEGEEISAEDYKAKYAEFLESIKKLSPKLFEKLEEIEKEKAKAAAEAASVPIVTKKSKPRTNKQKLEAAANKKEHGNKLFVDLDYANAVRRYTQALELVQSLYDETPEQKDEANKLKVQCYLNIAGCLQKVQGFQKAVENCKQALDIEPDNAKALFRRGQAYFELKEFELARDDLTKADKLTPGNKQILHLLARSKNEITKRQEREKKMYSKMFN